MRADLKRLKRETESGRVPQKSDETPAASGASSPSAVSSVAAPSASAIAASRSGISQPAPSQSSASSGRSAASSSSVLIAEAGRHKSVVFAAAAIVILLLAAAGFGIYKFFGHSGPAIDTRNISIRPMTEHGQSNGIATISADGRLVAYGRREGERSLRVKQVTTGSEVTVVPPQTGFYGGATFTPDGNYLYYAHGDPTNGNNTNLYVVPALGGASRQIVSDVNGAVAFSPDGKRMAYRRTIQDKSEYQLLIANADGSDEKVVFRRETGAKQLYSDPSWSVSSDLIAISALELGTECFVIHSGAYSGRQAGQEFSLYHARHRSGMAARLLRVVLHWRGKIDWFALADLVSALSLWRAIQDQQRFEPVSLDQCYGGRQVLRHHPRAATGDDLCKRFSGRPQ